VIAQARGRGYVVHYHVGGVLAVALILVDDASAHGVAARPVVEGTAGAGGAAAGGVGRASERAVMAGEGGVEASTGVALDGSNWLLKLIVAGLPSLTGPLLLNVAVGATLATVTVKVAESTPPSLSVTVTVTV